MGTSDCATCSLARRLLTKTSAWPPSVSAVRTRRGTASPGGGTSRAERSLNVIRPSQYTPRSSGTGRNSLAMWTASSHSATSGEFPTVAERATDLEVRIRPSKPGQADLERRASIRVPHQVHFVRDDDPEAVEPRTPAPGSPSAFSLVATRMSSFSSRSRRKIEVPDREAHADTERAEPLELLRLLARERAERDEVETGAAGAHGAQEGEVRHERLPARGGAGQKDALSLEHGAKRHGLRGVEVGDPVLHEDLPDVGVDRRLPERNGCGRGGRTLGAVGARAAVRHRRR